MAAAKIFSISEERARELSKMSPCINAKFSISGKDRRDIKAEMMITKNDHMSNMPPAPMAAITVKMPCNLLTKSQMKWATVSEKGHAEFQERSALGFLK